MKHNKVPPPIICVGFPRWEGDYLKSTVQLMREMAHFSRVLYVDYPFTWLDVARERRGRSQDVPTQAILGRSARLQAVAHESGNLFLLRLPPFWPANFLKNAQLYDTILRWNAGKARRCIKDALAQLGWTDQAPIVINAFNPALGNALAGQLGEQQLVYYCYDEISAAPWVARHGTRHERLFMQKAQLTVVSSEGLLRAKSPLAQRCLLVKNGVDLALFKPGHARPTDLPAQSIIGYIGSVDLRLDYELLYNLAKAMPHAALVMVGRITEPEAAQKLAALPNVHLLGSRPPTELAAYIEHFDVGLIPFVKSELTAGIYPLKINEYLALGLPVVSTRFAPLQDFEGMAAFADDTRQFLDAVYEALSHPPTDTEVAARQRFASENTWPARAEQLADALFQPAYTT